MQDTPDSFVALVYADPPFFTQRGWGQFNDRWDWTERSEQLLSEVEERMELFGDQEAAELMLHDLRARASFKNREHRALAAYMVYMTAVMLECRRAAGDGRLPVGTRPARADPGERGVAVEAAHRWKEERVCPQGQVVSAVARNAGGEVMETVLAVVLIALGAVGVLLLASLAARIKCLEQALREAVDRIMELEIAVYFPEEEEEEESEDREGSLGAREETPA